ncbi:hypothetical protein PIB30_071856, partial [Stylosanthes scabra]|nr:hypothetical protein [Stylosanthes scabra]
HLRLLGIEKGIEKAKESIGSKRFTRGSQEEENKALCGCAVPSCIRTCPSERFGKNSAPGLHDRMLHSYALAGTMSKMLTLLTMRPDGSIL